MIRPATPADVPAIVELLLAGQLESPRWGPLAVNLAKLTAAIGAEVARGGTFVAEQQNRLCGAEIAAWDRAHPGEPYPYATRLVGVIVGVARAYFFGDAGYASNMQFYVAPAARGGMIGVQLIRAFEAWAASVGVDEIRITVDAGINDETALGIVRRLGYRQTAVSYSRDL